MAIGPNDVTTMLAHRDSRSCLDAGSAWDEPIPPDALADRVVTESDVVVDIDVLANDHDFSCETLSISSWDATSQAGGTVELALSGGNEVLRYTPPALFFGNDSFSYTVLDLEGFTDTTSVSITVITLGDIRVGSYCPQQYNTDSIQDALISGEKVTISDFGTFTVSHRRAFQGHNPKNREVIQVPERRIPVFRAGKGLKEALNDD